MISTYLCLLQVRADETPIIFIAGRLSISKVPVWVMGIAHAVSHPEVVVHLLPERA